MQSEYKVRDGQSICDLAIQLYGTVMGIAKILQDNTSVLSSLDTELESGMIIRYDPTINNITTRIAQQGQIVNTYGISFGSYDDSFDDSFN